MLSVPLYMRVPAPPSNMTTAGVYATYVSAQSLTLCELLEAFPSCKPTAGLLLSLLPPLPPRYYSMASSQLATPHSLAVAFSVVSYTLPASSSPTTNASGNTSSSSSGVNPEELSPPEEGKEDGTHCAAGVVRRRGLCTNWLEDILQPFLQGGGGGGGRGGRRRTAAEISIPVFVKPTKEFLLPASAKWPCVLIGPGTG